MGKHELTVKNVAQLNADVDKLLSAAKDAYEAISWLILWNGARNEKTKELLSQDEQSKDIANAMYEKQRLEALIIRMEGRSIIGEINVKVDTAVEDMEND